MDDDVADDARFYRGWDIEIATEQASSSSSSVSIYARLKRPGWPTLLVGRAWRGAQVTDELRSAVIADARRRIDEIEGGRLG